LLDKLEANIAAADAKGQHGAVNGSIGLMAQLRGLLINRTEIGAPGAFTEAESIEDVARLMLADGPVPELLENLDAIREEIMRQAADQAEVVATVPLAPRNEMALSLAALRPVRKDARRN
jgi:hypothetical protein